VPWHRWPRLMGRPRPWRNVFLPPQPRLKLFFGRPGPFIPRREAAPQHLPTVGEIAWRRSCSTGCGKPFASDAHGGPYGARTPDCNPPVGGQQRKLFSDPAKARWQRRPCRVSTSVNRMTITSAELRALSGRRSLAYVPFQPCTMIRKYWKNPDANPPTNTPVISALHSADLCILSMLTFISGKRHRERTSSSNTPALLSRIAPEIEPTTLLPAFPAGWRLSAGGPAVPEADPPKCESQATVSLGLRHGGRGFASHRIAWAP